jgi:hypothetical protein
MKTSFVLLAALLLAVCPSLYAASSSIRGTVTAGPNATPIANARVVLRGGGHEQADASDSEGRFEFVSLDPSITYSITVEAGGLNPYNRSGIVTKDGETQNIDIKLDLADLHTSVVVTDGIVNLEAASAEISQTIDPGEVQNLPSVTRNVTKYALLDPHVRQTEGLGGDYQNAVRLSINAASYRHTSFMLDGATNYDWVDANGPQVTVLPASVDDVKVMTGNYSAQYGNSTNGIIAVTTRSGTDTHHGGFFAYLRPSGPQVLPELAPYHIPNQKLDWGGLLGGPLVKGKTHYFGSYERILQDRGAVITVPALTFFNGQTNEYSGLLRIDHDLTNKNTLTTRLNGWHYASNNADDRISGGNQPSYGRTSRVQSWGGQVTDQAVIGNSVNVARFTYTNYVPDSATPLDPSVGVYIQNYAPPQNNTALQSGLSTWNWIHAQTETGGELFAFRRGRHDLKFGGEFVHLHVRDYSNTTEGTYYFYTAADFASLNPYEYAQTYGVADVRYGQQELSAYVQDDFHLARRLTANLGVRYEFESNTDSHHNFGPRVGLAWDATGDGKTVVRAGGGMFFDQYNMYLDRRFITLGPNSPQFNYTWYCTPGGNACPSYPNSVASPSGGSQSPFVSYLYIPAPRLLNPYSLQFSASVEREIERNTVLTVSGLQVHTLQQMCVNDINHPVPFLRTGPGQMRSVAAANATRPYTSYDGVQNVTLIDQIQNTASSIYQALDISIKWRSARWGQISGHYVYSGSYAYAMFYADYNSGVPSEWFTDWEKFERGPSDFYQRHHFIADAVLHGPSRTTLSLVGNVGSGLPVNPITGVDNNGDGYTVDRPVGFGRNSFRTPPQKTFDVSLAKALKVRKRLSEETRLEALNVLNSKDFTTVNNVYGNGATAAATFLAPKAGIDNSDPSRQLQFVVRLLF